MGLQCCTKVFILPKLLLHFLSLLTLIHSAIFSLFHLLGLPNFLEQPDGPILQQQKKPDPPPPLPTPVRRPPLRVALPIVDDKIWGVGGGVGLHGELRSVPVRVSSAQEIRRLPNCKHIFHRGFLDRWMDHNQITCPLCRTHLVPLGLHDKFNNRLWAAISGDAVAATANDDDYDEDITTTTTAEEFSSLFD